MLDCQLGIDHGAIERRFTRRDRHGDVRIRRELCNEEPKLGRLDRKLDKLGRGARQTRMFRQALSKRFNDVTQPLESISKRILLADLVGHIRHDQKRRALEQHNLLGAHRLDQLSEMLLNDLDVRDQAVDDPRPGFVQRLVPDAGLETGQGHVPALFFDRCHPLLVDLFSEMILHEIHLVDQTEDGRRWTPLGQRPDDRPERNQVAIELARLDVEDVDEYADIGEDVMRLRTEVVLHERVLSDFFMLVLRLI